MATAVAARTAPKPATALAPFRWMDDARTLGAALSSDGATLYRVSRTGDALSCECVGFATWGRTCRHIRAAQAALPAPKPAPAVRYCAGCHIEPSRDLPLCPACAAAAKAEYARTGGELAEDSGIVESDAETVALSDQIKREIVEAMAAGELLPVVDGDAIVRCPGYLRLHPVAPGSSCAAFWCAYCEGAL